MEVWSDADAHIVLFAWEPASLDERFLAFAVALEGLSVREPLILTVDAASDGWRATTTTADQLPLE